MSGWIAEERFDSALSFIHALSPLDPRWGERPDWWIYRGQADADWALNPSIFRGDPRFEIGGRESVQPRPTHAEQVELEARLVRLFVLGVDEQGSELPNEASFGIADWLELDRRVQSATGRSGVWPPPELLPLFALAQHYGVPTRLLDWSLQGRVAAYFAASEARRAERAGVGVPDAIAVWAYNHRRARDARLWEGMTTRPVIVQVPRFQNPNLNAQGGVFTLVGDEDPRTEGPAAVPPLDALISERARSFAPAAQPVLWKLVLPLSCAGEALRRLRYERVSATHLFPGYDGVVEGLRERALWDDVTFPWDY